MNKLVKVGLLLATTAAVVAGSWYYRPWSDYSPATVIKFSNAEDRVPAYRAMDTFFPHRVIQGAEMPIPLPRTIMPLDISYDVDGVTRTIDQYAADYDITGLMVVKDGNVLYENYWQGETAEDLHTSWSVAKSFVSTLIGIAIQQGRIESVDQTVAEFAPIYEGTDYGTVTIAQLLAMSSGIDFNEDYEVRGSDIRKLFFNTFFMNRDMDKAVKGYEQNREAGTDFHYISSNTAVLGAVVSAAFDGEPLADIVSRELFEPMAMSNGTWLTDRNTNNAKELPYCCLQITLEDYAKFGQFYLMNGNVDGQQIIPEDWRDFVSTPPSKAHMENELARGAQYGYGMHFWVPPAQDGAFFAAGYNAQFVYIDPNTNVVVAMTSADTKYPEVNREAFRLKQAAVRAAVLATAPLAVSQEDEPEMESVE